MLRDVLQGIGLCSSGSCLGKAEIRTVDPGGAGVTPSMG